MKPQDLLKVQNPRHYLLPVFFLALILTIAAWSVAVLPAYADKEQSSELAMTDNNIWHMQRWSPYWVGIGIGLLSWIAFVLSDKPIGVSTAYAQTSGMIEKAVQGRRTEEKAYYREYVPEIGWGWMLVVGLFIGAFVSALTSGDFRFQWVPPLWENKFGFSPIIRWAAAFSGGVILGIGARWADGCTSGHGISGTLQLVVSSWIAVICFLIGGILIAHIIY